MIYFTSDTHFCHDREFIYKPRGYTSISSMNKDIIQKWNSTVAPNDIVYHLGDVMLGNNKEGLDCLTRLNGKIHIILGNHDTDTRAHLYKTSAPNVISVDFGDRIKYKGIEIWLSHHPMILDNCDNFMKKVNFFGHTHQKERITADYINGYNVGMDANNCTPVSIEEIFTYIKTYKERNKV